MGRVAELNLRGSEYTPCLISIDKSTNELVAVRQEHVYIPQEVSGVKLTAEEIRLLKEGQPVKVEGMTSKAGKEFDATLQYSAERRGLEFIFPKTRFQRTFHRRRASLAHPDKNAQRRTYHSGGRHEVQEQE